MSVRCASQRKKNVELSYFLYIYTVVPTNLPWGVKIIIVENGPGNQRSNPVL